MSDKVAFFYLHGTDGFVASAFANLMNTINKVPRLGELTVAGLDGRTAVWIDGNANNDVFPALLDPSIFEARKMWYPSLNFPMGASINVGIANMVGAINALPKGKKFGIGGYSQGAAAASSVMKMLSPGGSMYADRGADFIGGIAFGNPRRQQDYRGEVGGTWSGSWDVPGSTTGGRGLFSPTGPFPRLTNCDPTKWIEFTHTDDIMSSHGGTQVALNATTATNAFLNLLDLQAVLTALGNPVDGFAALAGLPFNPDNTLIDDWNTTAAAGSTVNTYTDATGRQFNFPGAGHVAYPWVPPVGDPDNGLTHFQIAVKWLTAKALESATAPILLPSEPVTTASAGWSTTLIPPAA